MRKRFLMAGLLAIPALMAACSDDDGNAQAAPDRQHAVIDQESASGTKRLVLHGVSDAIAQKTMLDDGGKSVLFTEGDEISLFDAKRNNCKFSSEISYDGKSADFSGDVIEEEEGSDKNYYILYPYQEPASISEAKIISATLPATQVATQGSFDPAANLSVAICENSEEFTLKNIGSLLKLTTTEALSKIVVRSNYSLEGEEPGCPNIAGNIKIAIDANGVPSAEAAADAVSEIELVPASGENSIAAGTYYVALLPVKLGQGLTIEFYKKDASGTEIKVSDTYKRFQKEISFARNSGKNCGELLTANGAYIDMVKVNNTFSIGRFEVTQALWYAVMGTNPSKFKDETSGNYSILPVEMVTWDNITGANGFLDKLNEITGKTFRLPKGAEWLLAAKAGEDCPYSGSSTCSEVAWYSSNSGWKTHLAGTKKPNGLGIYDMSGNVSELCQDVANGNQRLLVGGAFGDSENMCKIGSSIVAMAPDGTNSDIGFRLAIGHGPATGFNEGFDDYDI